MASSAFIVFVIKNFVDVAHTPCITLDKANDFCLSGTTTPGSGSKCDLYLVYLDEAKNVFLLLCSAVQTESYIADKRYFILGQVFPACCRTPTRLVICCRVKILCELCHFVSNFSNLDILLFLSVTIMEQVLIKNPNCARSKEQSEFMNFSKESEHCRRYGSEEPSMRYNASIMAAMVCCMSKW